jgi:hypothetical protein
MLQRGICKLEDLVYEVGSLSEAKCHLRRPCYIGLYEEVLALDSYPIDPLLEAILASFATSNGAFKRTTKARFRHFDEQVVSLFGSLPSLGQRYIIHDLAVSDARTACDFFFALTSIFGERIDFYATDLCLRVFVLQKTGARTRVVVDDRDNVLQVVFPPLVLSEKLSRRQRFLYPANKILRLLFSRTTVKEILRLAVRGDSSIQRQEILLICPEARKTLENHHNFHVETHDVFGQTPRRYSAVRAMNLFNLTYFSESAIATAIRRIYESLYEGGMLITGSNDDPGSTVDGGVYRKQGGSFTSVYRSGAGSAIDHLVLSCPE